MKKSVGIGVFFILFLVLALVMVGAVQDRTSTETTTTDTTLKEAGEEKFSDESPLEIIAKSGKTIIESYVTKKPTTIYFNTIGSLEVPAGVRVVRMLNKEIEITSVKGEKFEVGYRFHKGGLFGTNSGKYMVSNNQALYFVGDVSADQELDQLLGTSPGFLKRFVSRVRYRNIGRNLRVRTPTAVAAVRG